MTSRNQQEWSSFTTCIFKFKKILLQRQRRQTSVIIVCEKLTNKLQTNCKSDNDIHDLLMIRTHKINIKLYFISIKNDPCLARGSYSHILFAGYSRGVRKCSKIRPSHPLRLSMWLTYSNTKQVFSRENLSQN